MISRWSTGRRSRRRTHGSAGRGQELSALPGPAPAAEIDFTSGEIAVELKLDTDLGVLSFISTNTAFDTATDITLAELSIESFFPADAITAEALGATWR